MKTADNLIQCKGTFMWLYKPIENRQNTTHTGVRSCACTLEHTHDVHTRAYTQSNTQCTVCNSFKDWSCVFMFRDITHTHTSNESHTLKPVQRESIFSIWGDFANSLSLTWLTLSGPKASGPRVHAPNQPRNAGSWFKGPTMLFPEPHRGFSENKSPNENTCAAFILISLDAGTHVITIFCFNQEPFRTHKCWQLKKYFDSISCKWAIFVTDERSHQTACSH